MSTPNNLLSTKTQNSRRPDPDLHKTQATECCGCQLGRQQRQRFCAECGQRIEGPTPKKSVVDNEATSASQNGQPNGSQLALSASPSPLDGPTEERISTPKDHEGTQDPVIAKDLMCACGELLPSKALFCLICGEKVGVHKCGFRVVELPENGHAKSANITDAEVIIGKDPSCDLVVDGDDYISRRHARLAVTNDILFLDDLASANGSYLRVTRSLALEPGDEFVIGTRRFRVKGF